VKEMGEFVVSFHKNAKVEKEEKHKINQKTNESI
jgi:hypothetical protein